MSVQQQYHRGGSTVANPCNHSSLLNRRVLRAAEFVRLPWQHPIDVSEYNTASRKVAIERNPVSLVAQHYVYDISSEVTAIINEHPQVAQTLIDAIPHIKKFFGEEVSVALRVSCDQESDPTLSANIQTTMGVSEARAARKSFYASWWMRQPDTDGCILTFNLEYV